MECIDDTIVALATPLAPAAIGIVRISGPSVPELLSIVFRSPPPPRHASLRTWIAQDGTQLDNGIVTWFPQNASFTGEATLEFSAHGNPLVLQTILDDAIRRGCRMAEPGEFTRRAYLNNRLSLTEAEAVGDLIAARSQAAIVAAQRQLAGGIGDEIHSLIEKTLNVIAHLEAYIDFPEEDLPDEDQNGPLRDLGELHETLRELERTGQLRELLHNGIRTAIVGPPNAGKSSLLNLLYGQTRALVSAEPGTTRDFIGEDIAIGDYRIHILDTAGIRDNAAGLEIEGIALTEREIRHADLVLLVLDGSDPTPPPDRLHPLLHDPRTLVVLNKSDLPTNPPLPPESISAPLIRVSTVTREGIDELRDRIHESIRNRVFGSAADRILYSHRHCAHLRRAARHMGVAREMLSSGIDSDLVVSEIRSGLDALGEIIGRVDNERVLDALFKTFCIGK